MQHPLLKVFAFFSVLLAIILSSIIFGGYSSFKRSENRIESSKNLLADSCRARTLLLPELSAFMTKKMLPASSMEQAAEKAEIIVARVLSQKLPLDGQMTAEFEAVQTDLTFQIKEIFVGLKSILDPDDRKSKNDLDSLIQKISKAQDTLYVAKDRYNYEVSYFNRRIKSFPVSLIAKLFGFNKTLYYPFSDQAFLPARKVFES